MLTAALLVACAPAAEAHSFLVRTSPQAGERLAAPPSAITLRFSEPIVLGSPELAVRPIHGGRLAVGPARLEDNGLIVQAGLPRLEQGIYLVSWEVLASDGHVSAGEFAFAVGPGGTLPTTSGQGLASVSWLGAVATLLFLAGLVVAVGGLASEVVVWRPALRGHGLAVPLAPVRLGLGVSLLGAILQLALLAGGQRRAGRGAAWDRGAWEAALATRPGALAAAQIILLAQGLLLVGRRPLRIWALLPLAGVVAASALRGHSGLAPQWWAAPANALHLALGAVWIGALVHLVVVLRALAPAERRPAVAAAAGRYAQLAILVVPPVLAFGVVTALAELRRLGDLVATSYGRVLLVKLLLVAGGLAVALAARLRALPATGQRLGRLRRLTRIEAGILLGAVGASALLTSVAPPLSAAARADVLGPPPLTGPVVRSAALAGQLAVHLAAAEGQVQIRVLAPGGEPAAEAQAAVELHKTRGTTAYPRGKSLYPRSCGAGCFTMGLGWEAGVTQLTVAVSGSSSPGGTATMTVRWPPGPDASGVLERVVRAMRAQPTVRLREQVTSGPGATGRPAVATFSGRRFMALELYAAGGAGDVRLSPAAGGSRELSFYLPGSDIWYRLWVDAKDRLRREVIVNPGHRIDRTFAYPASAGR